MSAMAPESFERPIRKRHLVFCRQVALGMSPCLAYKKYCLVRKSKVNPNTCMEQSSRYITRWHGYISSLRSKLAVAMDNAAIAQRVEMLAARTFIHRAPAEILAQPDSPFAKVSTIIVEGPEGTTTTTKVEGPDKLENASAIEKMAGYNEAEKVEHNVHFDTPLLRFMGILGEQQHLSNCMIDATKTVDALPNGEFRPLRAPVITVEALPASEPDPVTIGRKMVFKS